MRAYLAITIIADDRPGIVEKVADKIKTNGGNWLESNMSRLAGKFAGILLVSVAPENQTQLTDALKSLQEDAVQVVVEQTGTAAETDSGTSHTLDIVANDRPGIIAELSSLFARHSINVEELSTWCESAPMSADLLFRARAVVTTPADISTDKMAEIIESLSDDLVVEFES